MGSSLKHVFLNLQPRHKGYLYAFVATIALANVYIFSKAAMREINFSQFAFYWFGMAIIWNLLYIWFRKKLHVFRSLNKRLLLIVSIIGIFEVFGTYSFFHAIKIMQNPANVSFLANFVPIFVTIIGIVFLKERYNFIEIIGIALALFGTFLISYKGNDNLQNMFLEGSGLVLIASFSFAMAHVISKRFIQEIDPLLISLNRVIYLFVLAIVLLLLNGSSLIIPRYALINIFVGSILGPFLTAVAAFSSLLYIEASRSAIIQSTKGLFVVVGAIIYFGILPHSNELTGGIISIVGVILISAGKRTMSKILSRRVI